MEGFEKKMKNVLTPSYWKQKSPGEIVSEDIIQALSEELGHKREYSHSELCKEMVRLFESLSPEQKEVMTLIYANGNSYEDIAKHLGKSEEIVSQIRARATKSLRNMYIDYYKNKKF